MAILDNVIIATNKALNRLPGLASQARSYYSNPAMLKARGVASKLANTAWSGAKTGGGYLRGAATSRSAMIGAGAGAIGGGAYDYFDNPRSNMRSMLGAGLKGAAAGGVAGMGAYGLRQAGGFKGLAGLAKTGAARARSGASNLGPIMSGYGNRASAAWGRTVSNAEARVGLIPVMGGI